MGATTRETLERLSGTDERHRAKGAEEIVRTTNDLGISAQAHEAAPRAPGEAASVSALSDAPRGGSPARAVAPGAPVITRVTGRGDAQAQRIVVSDAGDVLIECDVVRANRGWLGRVIQAALR